MVRETTINYDLLDSSPCGRVKHGLSRSARDISMLLQLQWSLLVVDVRVIWRRILVGLTFFVIGSLLMMAAIPIVLMGSAAALSSAANISIAASLLWIAGGATLLGGGFILAAWIALRHRRASLKRSYDEFHKNISLIKAMLFETEES
jgi:hypothetical protein